MSEKLVDRFARGVEVAKQAGWDVRFANLSGTGGGWCRVAERSFVFVDLSLDVLEQLDRLEEALELAVADNDQQAEPALVAVRDWLAQRS